MDSLEKLQIGHSALNEYIVGRGLPVLPSPEVVFFPIQDNRTRQRVVDFYADHLDQYFGLLGQLDMRTAVRTFPLDGSLARRLYQRGEFVATVPVDAQSDRNKASEQHALVDTYANLFPIRGAEIVVRAANYVTLPSTAVRLGRLAFKKPQDVILSHYSASQDRVYNF